MAKLQPSALESYGGTFRSSVRLQPQEANPRGTYRTVMVVRSVITRRLFIVVDTKVHSVKVL